MNNLSTKEKKLRNQVRQNRLLKEKQRHALFRQVLPVIFARNKSALQILSKVSRNCRNRVIDPVVQKQMKKAANYNACLKRAGNACFPTLVQRQASAIYDHNKNKIHPTPGPSRSPLNNNARLKLEKHHKRIGNKPTASKVVENIADCMKFTFSPF